MALALRIPRTEAIRLLARQIELGERLLASDPGPSEFTHWVATAVFELGKITLTPQLALPALYHAHDVQEGRIAPRTALQSRLHALHYLKDRLELYPELETEAEVPPLKGEFAPMDSKSSSKAPARQATHPRPRLFVGSSTEGLPIARAIQSNLDHDAEVELWTQGVFQPSVGNLANLVRMSRETDFAALVLTPDDLVQKRSAAAIASPRDNVVFELGLFMGALAPERVFVVRSRIETLDLPTDLAGISAVTYEPHSTANHVSALGAACNEIRVMMQRLRARSD